MGILKTVVPYEILFRLKSDGTIAGMHLKRLQILFDEETGETNERELDPQPVEGQEIEAVIGVIATAQAVTIASLSSQIATLNNQIQLLESAMTQQ